jgi:hypothetical protein
LLSEEVRVLEPPLATRIVQPTEGQNQLSVWTALGVPPHPALYYVVTVPVDISLVLDAPLVLTRTARYKRTSADKVAPDIWNQIGGVVRSEQGEPLPRVKVALEGRASESETDEEGRFVLRDVPSGTVRLRIRRADDTEKIVAVKVPGPGSREAPPDEKSSYEIVLEATPASGN